MKQVNALQTISKYGTTIVLISILNACSTDRPNPSNQLTRSTPSNSPARQELPPQAEPPPEILETRPLTNRAGEVLGTFFRISDPRHTAGLGDEVWLLGTTLWGETRMLPPGTFNSAGTRLHRATLSDAVALCSSIQARLPTREEWIQLRIAFGAIPGAPDNEISLNYIAPEWFRDLEYQFWSSSIDLDMNLVWQFDGRWGDLELTSPEAEKAIRCVRPYLPPALAI